MVRECHHSQLQETWKMGYRRRRASCRGNILGVLQSGMKVWILYLQMVPRCLKAGFRYVQAIRHEAKLSGGSSLSSSHKRGRRTDLFASVSDACSGVTDPRLHFSMYSLSQSKLINIVARTCKVNTAPFVSLLMFFILFFTCQTCISKTNYTFN